MTTVRTILTCLVLCIITNLQGQNYVVNSNNDVDDGMCNAAHCSLREAINIANRDLVPSVISFAIPGGVVETINLTDALPPLEERNIQILGSTQTGNIGGIRLECSGIGPQYEDIISIWSDDTYIEGFEIFNYTVSENAMIQGAGSLIGVGSQWIARSAADVLIENCNLHSTFRARATAENYANGIDIHSGENVEIRGCVIGTNWAEDMILPCYGNGIRIDEDNFGESTIGNVSSTPAHANVIGNCLRGIFATGGEGQISGNYVGTNRAEDQIFPNINHGIQILGSSNYDVGGRLPDMGNVCAHNTINGIDINAVFQIDVENNRVYSNTIGIRVDDPGMQGVYTGHNIVHNNTTTGISYFWFASSTNMTITENSTYCNGRGIEVAIRAPTSPFDNILITSFDIGTATGTATPGALMEIFEHSDEGCPNSFCQGKFFIGNTTCDAAGVWTFNGALLPGRTYTATQTLTNGNTSPFGPCFTIPGCNTIVTTILNDGPGSLRAAIECANATIEGDTITFNIPGPGPHEILLSTELPYLVDDTIMIDGTTEPGNFPMNEQIIISAASSIDYGLPITNSVNGLREIFGLVLNGFNNSAIYSSQDGILRIGNVDKGNVFINNQIGLFSWTVNQIDLKGNYFGTNQNFDAGLQNISNNGLILVKSGVVGGDRSAGEGNYFAPSTNGGMVLQVQEDYDLEVLGNNFGVDNTGLKPIGPSSPTHFALHINDLVGYIGNVNIGKNDEHRNIFAYNNEALRVRAIQVNVSNNSFYCNDEAIVLEAAGNNNKISPTITVATTSNITGISQPFDVVEIYLHDTTGCPDAACQGKILLATVNASPNGQWFANTPFSIGLNDGDFITALATDPEGNTSEFATCVEICPDIALQATNSGPYCAGDIIELFGSVASASTNIIFSWSGPGVYSSNAQNPTDATRSGRYFFQANVDGCIYPVVETDVIINPRDTINIDTTICRGDVIVINGMMYDDNNTSGTVRLRNIYDCDSILEIQLSLNDTSISLYNAALCADDFIMVNNKRYDINNPSGSDTLSKANGCDSIFLVDLTFRPEAVNNVNLNLCFGQTFTANGKVYDENNPMGSDTLLNSFGCDSIINVNISYSNAAINNLDTSICPGEIIIVNGKIYNELNTTGSDTIIMGSSGGCDSIINVNVQVGSNATNDIDTLLCESQDLIVNGRLYDRFNPQGRDTLFGLSSTGCDSIVTIFLRFPDPTFTLDTIAPSCDGQDDGAIIITQIDGIPGPYTYSVNGSPVSMLGNLPFTINGLDEGNYDILISDADGCTHLIQMSLQGGGNISISTPSEVNIQLGEDATLSFSASFIPDSIRWSPDLDIDCLDCPTVTVSPTEDRTYTVIVYKDGCFTESTILVRVSTIVNVFVPNSFSPNGDGINDFFNVFTDGTVEQVSFLRVYDRWGEMIYQGIGLDPSDSNAGWNGRFGDELVNPGVYVFHLEVILTNGDRQTFSGDLTLVE